MYRLASFLIISVVVGPFCSLSSAQDEAAVAKKAEPAFVTKFGNLPQEKREAYGALKVKAEQFFRQKRIFECLDKIHEASEIFDEDPATWNLKGSCYVEFRSFNKARNSFQRALALEPNNTGVIFNLAEMDFVCNDWRDCIKKMKAFRKHVEKQSPELEGGALDLHRLAAFKQMIAHLKLGDTASATQLAEKNWADWDDTPFTDFSKGVLAIEADDQEVGDRWIKSAMRVFSNSAQLPNWQDTMIEAGYLKSFYGGDDEEE